MNILVMYTVIHLTNIEISDSIILLLLVNLKLTAKTILSNILCFVDAY